MRNVRRLYFYLVTLIGLELVIWGAITLAQTLLDAPVGGTANILASGLSLILVGVPIFLLHGAAAQRDAMGDPEERANRLRAIFFNAVRLATLIPVVQSAISVVVRLLVTGLGFSTSSTYIGLDQTLADHLVVIAVNGLALAYFDHLLRGEALALPENSPLSEVRRLYRYVWMIYTLVLAVLGSNFILSYVFYLPTPAEISSGGDAYLVNGLALALVGAPLWAFSWRNILASLDRPGESSSLLRRVVLYGLTILPAVFVVIMGVSFVSGLFSWALGEAQTLATFSIVYRAPLALVLTLGTVWAFFFRPLAADWAREAEPLRKASLIRLYQTLISLLANATTFIGAWMLLSMLVDSLLGTGLLGSALRSQLSGAAAAIAIGIPLWMRSWKALQTEARRRDDEGDHARRSVLRRSYFYLVIFLAVVGVMVNAGMLLFLLFNAALGNPVLDLASQAAHAAVQLGLFTVWLAYHLRTLRQDGRQAQRALAEQHAAFPVLVFQTEEGPFFAELQPALQTMVPGLPVTVFRTADNSPIPPADSFKAVILPSAILADPSVELAAWLHQFTGRRLVAPLAGADWVWLGTSPRPGRELARETALAVRQLAEGEPLRPAPPNNPWVIAGYVFGGLFSVELLLVAFAIVMSMISR